MGHNWLRHRGVIEVDYVYLRESLFIGVSGARGKFCKRLIPRASPSVDSGSKSKWPDESSEADWIGLAIP
jgi:hypothetical protein